MALTRMMALPPDTSTAPQGVARARGQTSRPELRQALPEPPSTRLPVQGPGRCLPMGTGWQGLPVATRVAQLSAVAAVSCRNGTLPPGVHCGLGVYLWRTGV